MKECLAFSKAFAAVIYALGLQGVNELLHICDNKDNISLNLRLSWTELQSCFTD